MPIDINKPVVVASKQQYFFDSVFISKDSTGLRATVNFNLLDQNNQFVKKVSINYTGHDFNTFWQNFNSGTYLYQELAKLVQAGNPPTNSMESEFKNA